MSVADYYKNVNPDLLALIPPAVQRVAETGCGAASMAMAFKQQHPNVHWTGIELFEEAAQIARGRIERVIVGNIETLSDEQINIPAGSLDCILFGDVLEHMVDPWQVLKRQVGWLRPGGAAVACIPNIQHWSMLVRVLSGRWIYEQQGLMDRTHLRFFSIETIQDMFQSAGLEIREIHGRAQQNPRHAQVVTMLQPALQALGVDLQNFEQRSSAVQYVIVAQKPG